MLTTILTALTLGSVPALPSSRLCPVTVSPSGPRPGQFVRVSLRAGCGGVLHIVTSDAACTPLSMAQQATATLDGQSLDVSGGAAGVAFAAGNSNGQPGQAGRLNVVCLN